ncbi:MAG: hypothetical protein QM654_05855 [Dysgonamonadaceae bacterium]
MKKIVIISFWIMAFSAFSQQSRNAFLFKDLQPATVHFSNGQTSKEKVNFNMVDNQVYFLDKNDSQVKVINQTILIDSINTEQRTFLYDAKNGIREIVSHTPLIYVQYIPKQKIGASQAAYGGTSETSSVSTYSQFRTDGVKILQDLNFDITKYETMFWIINQGKEKKFSGLKELIKIFPNKGQALKEYNSEKHINFKNIAEVVAACEFASK